MNVLIPPVVSPLFPLQSFSNADLVDEEPLLTDSSCSVPQWRCYAKFISPQQILLTFLPASFTGTLSFITFFFNKKILNQAEKLNVYI